MIASLTGRLAAIGADGVVVDVAGVGYEVAAGPRTIEALGPVGTEVTVHTHLHVREEIMALYGFASPTERQLFRTLISASGVGPKVGLAVLSTMTSDELTMAVANDDADALTVVPGIGKRTAQKLVLELRPKLAGGEAASPASPTGQVRAALEGLGFTSQEITDALESVDRSLPVEEQVRKALQQRGAAR